MKYLKNANGIKVGDKFRYRGSGYGVDGTLIAKGKMYDAEVVSISTHIITLRITLDKTTVDYFMLGDSKPYTWAIRKVDVGRTERLYLPTKGE